MIEAMYDLLWRYSLLFSGSVVLVLAARRLTLRRFGASCAYLCWALLPLLLLVPCLPHAQATQALLQPLAALSDGQVALAALSMRQASSGLASAAVGLWLLGAGAFAIVVGLRQRSFMASLQAEIGTMQWRSPAQTGPALVGLWRPRLVLPQDFERCFCAAERALILAHEEVHRRRHDNLWNLLATVMCGLQWFNPLAWLAWRRMRADQELSCDAAVLRARPWALADYVKALLKAQDGVLAFTLACRWQSSHPLVERIAMLKLHPVMSSRLAAGRRWLLGMGLLCAGAVYALQPSNVVSDKAEVKIDLNIEWHSKDIRKKHAGVVGGPAERKDTRFDRSGPAESGGSRAGRDRLDRHRSRR